MPWCADDDGSVGKMGDLREVLDDIENLPSVEPQEDVKDILDKIMDEVEVKESPFHTVYAKGVQDGIDRCIAIIKKYRNSV